jgi:hypothetical protein
MARDTITSRDISRWDRSGAWASVRAVHGPNVPPVKAGEYLTRYATIWFMVLCGRTARQIGLALQHSASIVARTRHKAPRAFALFMMVKVNEAIRTRTLRCDAQRFCQGDIE